MRQIPVRYLFKNRKVCVEFKRPDNTRMLRLDPGELAKGLKISRLTWEDGNLLISIQMAVR